MVCKSLGKWLIVQGKDASPPAHPTLSKMRCCLIVFLCRVSICWSFLGWLSKVFSKAYLGFNLTTPSLDLVSIGWFTDASWGCVVFMKGGDLGVRKCSGCISEFNADINVGRLRSLKGWSLKLVPTFPVTVASCGELVVNLVQTASNDYQHMVEEWNLLMQTFVGEYLIQEECQNKVAKNQI